MNIIFQVTGQKSVYDIFSTISHSLFQYNSISYNETSAAPPTSQKQLTRECTGLFEGYMIKNQPHKILSNRLLNTASKGLDTINTYVINTQTITYVLIYSYYTVFIYVDKTSKIFLVLSKALIITCYWESKDGYWVVTSLSNLSNS